MTAKEIIKAFEESGIGVTAFAYGDIYAPDNFEFSSKNLGWKERQLEFLESMGVGDFEEVKQVGGEGQGETWYSVKYFPKHDVYIKTEGFYSSYNGTDFDDGYGEEVKPTQKTITVYE